MTTKAGKRSGRRSVSKQHQTVVRLDKDGNINANDVNFDAEVINCSIIEDGMFGKYFDKKNAVLYKVRYMEQSCCTWAIIEQVK